MTAVDTSVVVPALLAWHEHHEPCRRAAVGAHIPAHVLVESYSVMTRLPSPHRVAADVAETLLTGWFDRSHVMLAPAALQRDLVRLVSAAGVEGGAIYDGLIGLTVRAHGEHLVTRDGRAATTYEALGVDIELVGT